MHAGIEDRDAVADAMADADAVVNFAAETHVDRSIAEPDAFVFDPELISASAGSRATVNASNSAAWRHAAPLLEVGKPSAPQVVTILEALAGAGAPAEVLAVVWSTFTGQA